LFFAESEELPTFNYDNLLDEPMSESDEEEYGFLAAPKKNRRRNENVFAIADDEDLAFDLNKKCFIDETPVCGLNFDLLLDAEELPSLEVECFEPTFYLSQGKKANLASNLFQPSLSMSSKQAVAFDAPAIMSGTMTKQPFKLLKEKSFDGSISSSRRMSMLKKYNKA